MPLSLQAMVMCGILLGFAIGYAFELHDNGWVWTFRIAYLLAIAMGGMSLYLPNSPSWSITVHYPNIVTPSIINTQRISFRMVSQEYEAEEVLEAVRFIHPHATEHSVEELMQHMNEQFRSRLT